MADALHRHHPAVVSASLTSHTNISHWTPTDDVPSSSFPYNHGYSYDSPTSTPSRPAYVAYKPSSCDTPPASPPLRAPYTHGLSAKRGLLPIQLNMDTAV